MGLVEVFLNWKFLLEGRHPRSCSWIYQEAVKISASEDWGAQDRHNRLVALAQSPGRCSAQPSATLEELQG